jgi:hypothetical protein
MNTNKNREKGPQQQTAENPSGKPIENPFENHQSAEKDIEQAKEALEKEQQYKEVQTERD